MAEFQVTTVENVYEHYVVSAASPEEARRRVGDGEWIASSPAGSNGDVEIVAVHPQETEEES